MTDAHVKQFSVQRAQLPSCLLGAAWAGHTQTWLYVALVPNTGQDQVFEDNPNPFVKNSLS